MQGRTTKLKVECGRWCQKVADSCIRPGTPTSKRLGHEIRSTDLQNIMWCPSTELLKVFDLD